MDETILVEVCIPTVQLHVDIEIMKYCTCHEFLSLLYEIVMERLQDGQMVSYFAIMYHVPSHKILPLDQSVSDCHIETGDCIYIF